MALEGGLDVTVDRDRVEFALTVTNADTEPVELPFASGQIADFAVSADEAEVWRWSEGRMFTQVQQSETLAPGEAFTRSATWSDPSPGEYTVEASLATIRPTVEKRRRFRVPTED